MAGKNKTSPASHTPNAKCGVHTKTGKSVHATAAGHQQQQQAVIFLSAGSSVVQQTERTFQEVSQCMETLLAQVYLESMKATQSGACFAILGEEATSHTVK